MKPIFTEKFLEEAHRHTISNEQEAKRSHICTCMYCGHRFDPEQTSPEHLWDEGPARDRTLACPMCGIDAVLAEASGFPVTEPEFIKACSEQWFNGYSRISDNREPEHIVWTEIELP